MSQSLRAEEWLGACSDGSCLGPSWEKQGRGLGTCIVVIPPRVPPPPLSISLQPPGLSGGSLLSQKLPDFHPVELAAFQLVGLVHPGVTSTRGHLSLQQPRLLAPLPYGQAHPLISDLEVWGVGAQGMHFFFIFLSFLFLFCFVMPFYVPIVSSAKIINSPNS